MKLIILLSVSMLFNACNECDWIKEDHDQKFVVAVLDGEYCNYITLEFQARDVAAIKRITGQEGNMYYGLQLTKIFVHPGQKLLVEIEKLNETEGHVCPTLLPTYPAVAILSLQIIE